jgi:hypothetical protein
MIRILIAAHSDRHRDVFLMEGSDGHRPAVFKHHKIALSQAGDQVLLLVQYHGMQHDLFNFLLKREGTVFAPAPRSAAATQS